MEYRDRVSKVIFNLENDHGVAWIYSNDRFIDIEVGENAKNLAKKMKIKL
jgi:hypothetical protein